MTNRLAAALAIGLSFAFLALPSPAQPAPAPASSAPASTEAVPAPEAVPAAPPVEAAPPADKPLSVGDYYFRGGFVMHFILLCSIFAAAISIERLYHYRRARTDHRKLLADIKALLAEELIYKAMARCDEDRGPVAHVLKAILKNKDRDADTVRDAVDQASLEELPRLERRMHILGVIPNVSTLLGLLGTIQGMIMTFAAIAATTTGVVNVHILANGIWTAMLTTFFGLAVAIPVTIVHTYLTSEIRKFAIAMEHSSAELVHYLQHQPSRGDEI